MTTMPDKDPRFARIERKVGLFILLAAAFLALVVAFIGIEQGVFTPMDTVRFATDSGDGLSPGQQVKFRGFKIGKVTKVKLNESGMVEVQLAIERKHMKWLRIDSTATLVQENLIGAPAIIINTSSLEKPRIENLGVIAFQRTPGFSQIGEQLLAKVTPIIEDLGEIVAYVNDPEGEIKGLLANVEELTRGLNQTLATVESLLTDVQGNVNVLAGGLKNTINELAGTVDGLVGAVRGEILPHVDKVLANADTTVSGVDNTVTQLRGQLLVILEKLEQVSADVKVMSTNFKDVSNQVPAMAEDAQQTLGDAQQIVNSVQELPLIRPKPVNPDSKRIKTDSYAQ